MRQADSGRRRTTRQTASAEGEPTTRGRRAESQPVEVVDEAVIRLAEETLTVDKRTVETGRVRVRRTTTERVQKIDVPLVSNTVEVRRVPVDKVVKAMPAVRETRTEIIIPVVEEVVVVERRLVLREELHIRKVRSVERHTEEVTLRAQKASVDRVAPQGSDDRPGRPGGSWRRDRRRAQGPR